VKRLLESRGIRVYGSPRPEAGPRNAAQLRWLYFRQSIGFVLWQIGVNI